MTTQKPAGSVNGVGRVGDYSLTNPRLDGLSIPDLISYRRMLLSIIDALIKGRAGAGFTHPITIPLVALMYDALKTIGQIDKRVIEILETTYEYTEQKVNDENLPF